MLVETRQEARGKRQKDNFPFNLSLFPYICRKFFDLCKRAFLLLQYGWNCPTPEMEGQTKVI
ncbi:unknown protein [Microcystis aeruginosa NIES-843]|uniref:Uncharacterized protein n=1 Tax=Microcystis aeruginosa (strain NIES-843 / IAM M-2473) TaxID=449447 RepID=B0JTF2_MICAN|nr:unknown protein [Microcystis aeruginosa NIES-843]